MQTPMKLAVPVDAPQELRDRWDTLSDDQKMQESSRLVRTRRQRLKVMPNNVSSVADQPVACGVFRKCEFADGHAHWIVVLDHDHREGDEVNIGKRDGTFQSVILGRTIPVNRGCKAVPRCFAIAPPLVTSKLSAWLKEAQPITETVQ